MKNIEELIKKYITNNKSNAYALNNYLKLKNKTFNFKSAIIAIIDATEGKESEINNVILLLTKKDKKFGRTQVYGDDPNEKVLDLIQSSNGVTLVGYDNSIKAEPKTKIDNPNPLKYKNSGEKKKIYVDTDKKISNLGVTLKKLYPNHDNDVITKMMAFVKDYSVNKKIGISKLINMLETGKLKLKIDPIKNKVLTIKQESVTNKKIIINNVDMIIESFNSKPNEITYFAFSHLIKSFLVDLLQNPIEAQPNDILASYGFKRGKLLALMLKVGLIEKDESIVDKDENGESVTAMMSVKYKVPKNKFEHKLHKLFIKLFEKNLPSKTETIEEDDGGGFGGATSANVSAAASYVQPMFSVQRRTFKK